MEKLIKQITKVQASLDAWKRLSLKETQTRATVIDPMLEALDWDVRDPGEVHLEYPTVDNKSVDYALKINGKAALLVEAKALDDPLNDVKAITQVVGYAANDGIDWCILTNGITWKIYKSSEKCPAPDKLMFEVSLDPNETEGVTISQVAEQMWRFSREEMAKGTLDHVGEQTFTDGKVRNALAEIMRDAPRTVLNLVRQTCGDDSLSRQNIRDSLARIWAQNNIGAGGIIITEKPKTPSSRKSGGRPYKKDSKAKKGSECPEEIHTDGKPREVLELYRSLDNFCLTLKKSEVIKKSQRRYINYFRGKVAFCSIVILQGGIRVYLKLSLDRLTNPPTFARDVSKIGHWGSGDVELAISNLKQVAVAKELVQRSFESVAQL